MPSLEPPPGPLRDAHRRGFVGALVAGGASFGLILLLWLLARGAPSAGGNPLPTLPPTASPATATPFAPELRFGVVTFVPAPTRPAPDEISGD